jgi:lipoprotein-anchoring transpeptidase ErfK/SrfK
MSRACSILVDVGKQMLSLHEQGENPREYMISTAANGVGQRMDSECTPLGKHIIRAKIGDKLPLNSIFVARRPTGEIFTPELRRQFPGRDWMLTRIMWLSGLEPGFNRMGDVDTMRRFIYIHGCPDDDILGEPGSHGCIKMRNADVVELFDHVMAGTPVSILAGTGLERDCVESTATERTKGDQ